MIRDVYYSEDRICDICGQPGAYNFMGDYICPDCNDGNYETGFDIDEEDEDDLDL